MQRRRHRLPGASRRRRRGRQGREAKEEEGEEGGAGRPQEAEERPQRARPQPHPLPGHARRRQDREGQGPQGGPPQTGKQQTTHSIFVQLWSLKGNIISCLNSAKLLRVVKLRSSQTLAADSLPSVCFYSVMNSGVSVSAIETSDDSSLLAIGFTNSHIKV